MFTRQLVYWAETFMLKLNISMQVSISIYSERRQGWQRKVKLVTTARN